MSITTFFAVLGLLGALGRVELLGIVLQAFSLAANICSIYYVFYPKTEFARSCACSAVLIIYAVLCILVFIAVCLYALLVVYLVETGQPIMEDEELTNDEKSLVVIIAVALIAAYSIPVFQCSLIFCIRRKRWEIANKMNSEQIQLQDFKLVPNPGLGNLYVAPNVPTTQPLIPGGIGMGTSPPPPDQPYPVSINQQVSPETQPNMSYGIPNTVSRPD